MSSSVFTIYLPKFINFSLYQPIELNLRLKTLFIEVLILELKLVSDYVFEKIEEFCRKLNGKVKREREAIECILPDKKDIWIATSSKGYISLYAYGVGCLEHIDTTDINVFLTAHNTGYVIYSKKDEQHTNDIRGSFKRIKVVYDKDENEFKFIFD